MGWTEKSWLFALFLGAAVGACSGTSKVVGVEELAVGGTGDASVGSVAGSAATADAGRDSNLIALGEPCIATDESFPDFAGFESNDINVDNNAPTCASHFCVQNHFQGRASCPYGQTEPATDCMVPGGTIAITVPVKPQLEQRQTAVASICSCQCSGYGPGPYCTCPVNMECDHLIDELSLPTGLPDLAGSYCVPLGSAYDRTDTKVCTTPDCGDAHPY